MIYTKLILYPNIENSSSHFSIASKLKRDISSNFNDTHSKNKLPIFVTLDVSKYDKSIISNELHP